MKTSNLDQLAQRLGYQFSQPELLQQSLTHRSKKIAHNERLEFLGDAIISFIIANDLYRRYPQAKEGEMSRMRAELVCRDSLAKIAEKLGLSEFIILSAGEAKSGGRQRPSILADAVEAVAAAIYLDAGIEQCQQCVLQWFATLLAQTPATLQQKDPKSELQEFLQGHKLPLPNYAVSDIAGSDHAQQFTVVCSIEGVDYQTTGEGSTRRAAEQQAAAAILEWLLSQRKSR